MSWLLSLFSSKLFPRLERVTIGKPFSNSFAFLGDTLAFQLFLSLLSDPGLRNPSTLNSILMTISRFSSIQWYIICEACWLDCLGLASYKLPLYMEFEFIIQTFAVLARG